LRIDDHDFPLRDEEAVAAVLGQNVNHLSRERREPHGRGHGSAHAHGEIEVGHWFYLLLPDYAADAGLLLITEFNPARGIRLLAFACRGLRILVALLRRLRALLVLSRRRLARPLLILSLRAALSGTGWLRRLGALLVLSLPGRARSLLILPLRAALSGTAWLRRLRALLILAALLVALVTTLLRRHILRLAGSL
jgi:hypothetical protein